MKAVPVKIDLVQAGLVSPENNPVSVLVSCSVLFTPPWLCAVWVVWVPHALKRVHARHRTNSRQIFFFIFIIIISSPKVVVVYSSPPIYCLKSFILREIQIKRALTSLFGIMSIAKQTTKRSQCSWTLYSIFSIM